MREIEIFTGPGCSYCEAAKKLLEQHNLPFKERDMSDSIVRLEFLERLPRVTSIPQIFSEGNHVGGYEDLKLRLS